MNKQQLSEALGPVLPFRTMTEKTALIRRAARLVERLLPGECGHCEGRGWFTWNAHTGQCPLCNGSGRVWDEGIVEAVREAILNRPPSYFQDGTYVKWATEEARAALSALAGLLTEKVKS